MFQDLELSVKDAGFLPRLVSKNGQVRVQMKNVPYKKSLVSDIFTTAVEMSWRLLLLLTYVPFEVSFRNISVTRC